MGNVNRKRKILIALIVIAVAILLYIIFLLNVAKSDFDSFTDTSPQYAVRVFTNFGADDQSLVPGNPVTEEVSICNLENYDAFVRLYLQSIFDVTYPDSVRNIALTQAVEPTPTGTISHEFVKRNDADTDWDSAPFEIGGATHLRVTYDPDGTAETGYSDQNTRNNIILYVAFGDHAADHWEYVGAYISDEKQYGSKFGWFVLKDTLHAGEVAPLLIKTITLGEEVVPYYSDLICDMDYQLESMQAFEGMNNLYLSK